MSQADRFLNACLGKPVDTTPIWIMRQAGRYLPSYREIRAGRTFLEMCRNPELACEVTLQPIDQIGMDAAILFSDILVIIDAMGAQLRFEEGRGPIIDNPVRTEADVHRLKPIIAEESLGYVMDAIRLIRKELDGRVPLIGFAGAPFTVATYLVAGGKSANHEVLKTMMFEAPEVYVHMMDKLTDATLDYLKAQIAAGAQAVQIFDTWAGVLDPMDFAAFELPYIQKLTRGLKPLGVPIIYYMNGAAGLIDYIPQCGADVIGVDWKVSLDKVVAMTDGNMSVQGNMDPCLLFGPVDRLRDRAEEVIVAGKEARGHVFNLGHGVMPSMEPTKVKALVDMVHEIGVRP